MIIFAIDGRINCQLWVTFQLLLAHIAVATASLVVYVIAMGAWVTNLACLIRGIVLIRSVWSPLTSTCMSPNSAVTDLNWIVSLSTDTLLLLIMLLSLFRRRYEYDGVSSLRRLLWNQGLIWLLLVTIAYVLPVVFITLNLNASFNMMFQTPALVTLSIAATRMYRSLTDFRSHATSISPPPKKDLVAFGDNWIHIAPNPPNRMEVIVHTESEQHSASQADHRSLSIFTEGTEHGDGIESGMEK
ncbi:hypothetical protein BC827DRAFT_546512 [Russula dissimulans]|nr:hypothetical protein BC827DRAFT_546512 [Russula dissimulans]